MSARTIQMDDRLYSYVLKTMFRDNPVAAELRRRTAELPQRGMQISPEQGAVLDMLVKLVGARRVLEIGTFTGYSGLAIARALPADGRLVCCDVSQEWTDIAREAWKQAGVADKITLRIAPALDTLADLEQEGLAGGFDMAFIDADKPNYDAYYESCLRLVRPGGLIAIDNVLWGGSVANPAKDDANVNAIRALNEKVYKDERVDAALLPVGDGLTLARVR